MSFEKEIKILNISVDDAKQKMNAIGAKFIEEERNELEEEYQKIREEYIKREREAKKENAKKRNMAALALSNKSSLKSSRDKDIELELKRMADEQIMDRISILEMNIEKWRAIIHLKKTVFKYISKILQKLEMLLIN